MILTSLNPAPAAAITMLLALAACAQSTAPPAPVAKDLRTPAEADVRAAVESFKKAITARDVDRILAFYASDGWQLPQNGPIAQTESDRRALWTVLTHLPIAQDAVDVSDRIDVADSGDLAVQYGEFRQETVDAKGSFKSVPQKFITAWRRQADGTWKISASMASVLN